MITLLFSSRIIFSTPSSDYFLTKSDARRIIKESEVIRPAKRFLFYWWALEKAMTFQN
jgi:hypothetical protein